jgi:DNA-binding transcriptional ArsR family regulator
MRRQRQEWGRIPTAWIEAGGLQDRLSWKDHGTAASAAMRLYTVLGHRLRHEEGIVHASYTELEEAACLARASVSKGLGVLRDVGLIAREAPEGQGSYAFIGYDHQRGWAKLPARPLYDGQAFRPFKSWTMRGRAERDAIALYLLLAARRDREANVAYLTYNSIEERTGLYDARITKGMHILANSGMIGITDRQRLLKLGVSREYRLLGLDTYNHSGTTGRARTINETEVSSLSDHVQNSLDSVFEGQDDILI